MNLFIYELTVGVDLTGFWWKCTVHRRTLLTAIRWKDTTCWNCGRWNAWATPWWPSTLRNGLSCRNMNEYRFWCCRFAPKRTMSVSYLSLSCVCSVRWILKNFLPFHLGWGSIWSYWHVLVSFSLNTLVNVMLLLLLFTFCLVGQVVCCVNWEMRRISREIWCLWRSCCRLLSETMFDFVCFLSFIAKVIDFRDAVR